MDEWVNFMISCFMEKYGFYDFLSLVFLWFNNALEMCILLSFSSLNCSLNVLCIKDCSLLNDGASLMVDAMS